MLANNIKLILLKIIIVVGLVFIISSSAQAGFVTVNPFEDINNPFRGCVENTWQVYALDSSTMFTRKIKVHNRVVIA
jgi:hypothetical protein